MTSSALGLSPAPRTAISTDGLARSYGTKQALSPLTLEVNAGEIFGLLGHNGAGKTTSEGYYQALTGLTLAAKSQTTINFDNGTAPGHYPENQFSLYRSSPNQVDFTIEVSAAGVQVARGTATKSAGTGEAVGG